VLAQVEDVLEIMRLPQKLIGMVILVLIGIVLQIIMCLIIEEKKFIRRRLDVVHVVNMDIQAMQFIIRSGIPFFVVEHIGFGAQDPTG
jgi:hypothetical protein